MTKHDGDDDTQVQADTLLIVYQRGFSDGKRSAQRKPLTDERVNDIAKNYALTNPTTPLHFARAIEQAHNIKEGT